MLQKHLILATSFQLRNISIDNFEILCNLQQQRKTFHHSLSKLIDNEMKKKIQLTNKNDSFSSVLWYSNSSVLDHQSVFLCSLLTALQSTQYWMDCLYKSHVFSSLATVTLIQALPGMTQRFPKILFLLNCSLSVDFKFGKTYNNFLLDNAWGQRQSMM